eukprot:6174873-Pleurochrysis_carterae.AAC.3
MCMALTAGIVLPGARQTTYISRWALSQMRLNFDLPLFSREELHRNPLLNKRVVQWEIGGARRRYPSCDNAPAAATSPLCVSAPTAAAEAGDVEHTVTEESELRSSKRISPLQVPEWMFAATTEEDEIRRITPEDQVQDPQIRFIRESHMHCFEGGSRNVVASTYTYSTRTCTDLCTRS